jgi:hypothetical protein
MAATLTFLHTSPVHIETFTKLMTELAPDIPVEHIVNESLLEEARTRGEITSALQERVQQTVLEAAEQQARVILCTCSTIGGCAESAALLADQATVLRVDRPMAERAVELGPRIIIAAALSSTLDPTRELILNAAQKAHKEVEIVELLCESAWAKFEQGDQAGYLQDIAGQLCRAAGEGDVIVLAQASMAKAAELCPELDIPILSSPRLGLEAAINAYRLGSVHL